jgi:hypothetical protein
MPNLVTAAILKKLDDPGLAALAQAWDELEALVVSVYRNRAATLEDEQEYHRLRRKLSRAYPRYQAALEPFWRRSRIKKEPVRADPFLAILQVEDARQLAADWQIMQTLPAAREALNQFLLSQVEQASRST